MTVLNNADAVMLGSQEVDAIYLGSTLVWGKSPIGKLFANGEQGVWYDPSDLSTMFQDAAGTTPVTAVGQPVGLMLDRRFGLARGPDLMAQSGWQSTTSTAWDVSVPGTATIVAAASAADLRPAENSGISFSPSIVGKWYEISFDYSHSGGVLGVYLLSVSPIAISPGTGTYRAIVQATASTHLIRALIGVSATVTNWRIREVPGNHATQTTTARKPLLQIDGNGKYYLAFDGADDSLSTGSIDFTGTDKMTVVAGTMQAGSGLIAELSANAEGNSGAFYLYSGEVAAGDLTFGLRGTTTTKLIGGGGGYPNLRVSSANMDIAGAVRETEIFPRINGMVASLTGYGSAGAGTGNFGNYPIYIGRRGGTSLPFNGHLYQLVVRGALTADLAPIETFTADKTGVTL